MSIEDDRPRSIKDDRLRSIEEDRPWSFEDDRPRSFEDDRPRSFEDDRPRSIEDDRPRSNKDNQPRQTKTTRTKDNLSRTASTSPEPMEDDIPVNGRQRSNFEGDVGPGHPGRRPSETVNIKRRPTTCNYSVDFIFKRTQDEQPTKDDDHPRTTTHPPSPRSHPTGSLQVTSSTSDLPLMYLTINKCISV